MKLTFFGHAEMRNIDSVERELLSILRTVIVEGTSEFYFGGYGMFDSLAYKCCKTLSFEATNYRFRFIFVTPYITEDYLKKQLYPHNIAYDEVVYPPIEKTPFKYAISARNKWMAENADLVISYVNHPYGGAYKSCNYALKKEKKIVNLGRFNFNNI